MRGYIKIIAAVIAFLCCFFEGFRRSRALKSRVEFLSEIIGLLNNFAIEIRTAGRTQGELIERENGKFAQSVKICLSQNRDIKSAWEAACDNLPQKLPETALLRDLGHTLGTADRESALKLISAYTEQINALKSVAEEDYSKKGRAFFRVGALCGAGAAILII